MNDTPDIFDTQVFASERAKFRKLAVKFGLAIIMLVLNNQFSAYLFVIIAALFSGGAELSYTTILVINEFSAYLFPTIILAFMFRDECRAFVPDKSYKPFLGEAVLMFTAGMSMGMLGSLTTQFINFVIDFIFGTGEIEDAFAGIEPQNMGEFGIFALCICIIAPIAEELIFRNLLLKPLRAYGDLTAAVVTGLLFGLYHGNFDQFAYASLTGIFFSIIAIRYNSIVPTIIVHAANNIIVTLGNDLPAACQSAPQKIRLICEDISAVCSFISLIIFPLGFISLVICIIKKCFKLHSHNRFIPDREALAEFVKTPLVIIGIIVMFIPFFVE